MSCETSQEKVSNIILNYTQAVDETSLPIILLNKLGLFRAGGHSVFGLTMPLCFVPQVQSHGSQGSSLLPSPPSFLVIHNHIPLSPDRLSPPAPPSTLPSPPILIMQLFSFFPGGGLPWTNIVSYASSSGGPYCVWRNGELTPLSEPSQWGHCVWIFLQLTQSHPRSLPCTGQATRGAPPLYEENMHITANKPSPQPDCFNPLLSVSYSFSSGLNIVCLCWWIWQKMEASGHNRVSEGGPCNSFFL